ncbi:putative zinc metalloproteinase [Spathaspora sp. JA1]|nr:putative zinc metalloproteinase [Spathaspora sp. JA1]
MTITFNYRDDEIVSSPTVLIKGRTSTGVNRGVIQFINNNNKVYPPQYFEVNNNGNFKAIIHVSPNEPNVYDVSVCDNGYIDQYGFPQYQGEPRYVDSGKLTLLFNPLPNNKPVHFCLIRGRDSQGRFDMPRYKQYPASLQLAIQKLKVGGRLMQAFTQEEMRINGFSNRCFQFVEEVTDDQGIFGYSNVKSPVPHSEIKIHVLTSPKTVAELHDANIAQQNKDASDSGFLFSHAIDLVKQCPDIHGSEGTAVQAACIYLDSTYDIKRDLILTHAALGGGDSQVAMAIFGSHGLHSWPNNFPQITPSFLDVTHLDKREGIANDCNECGTSWECLNITLGAFMHEIGHSLGCPHQVDGVMLRDYVWFNRSFMTRELQCLRTNSNGKVIGGDGNWDKECHWNRLDLMRFLYHDSFGLPIDEFDKISKTYKERKGNQAEPSSYILSNSEILVKSSGGIFMVEVITDDLARYHREFFPNFYGGPGLPHELRINYQEYLQNLRRSSKEANDKYDLRVLTTSGEVNISNFQQYLSKQVEIIRSDFGLGRGELNGIKSELLGQSGDKPMKYVGFDLDSVYKVRIYSGGALDGVKFYTRPAGPKLPPRNYLQRFQKVLTLDDHEQGTSEFLVGNEKPEYHEYNVPPGERITKFHVRNGVWIDAIAFETDRGNVSPMYGNTNGGHLSILECPGGDFKVVGVYSYIGSWMDGVGMIYVNRNS